MNFQIPQFIEQEAKIVGPLTLKQFMFLAAGGGLVFAFFFVFNFFFWFMLSVIIAAVSLSLAFVKVNGQEMYKVLVAALNYVWQPRTYTWQRMAAETSFDVHDLEKIQATRRSMNFQEKLKSTALNITTGKFFSSSQTKKPSSRYQVVTYLTGEKKMAKRVDY